MYINISSKEKIMFTVDTFIDTFQNGKKQFVATMVKNEVVAGALNQFIDAQTAYTKEAVAAFTEVGTVLKDEAIKTAKEAIKFDLSKFSFAK